MPYSDSRAFLRAAGAVSLVLAAIVMTCASGTSAVAAPATGPLHVSRANPRYFADPSGKIVYLTGFHTWSNLQDTGETDPPPAFDFAAYLNFLTKYNCNFIRLWREELTTWLGTSGDKKRRYCSPQPWLRTGPGKALDGKPRFDLTRLNPDYFRRLRSRVEAAREKGIYVSIMLFEGWGLQFSGDAWAGHPFNAKNNINGINGDANGDGKGLEIYELVNPKVTAIEEAYVRHVIDTVNDLDNVLYEISNENHPASTAWQYHMINFIHQYERGKPEQHPVGMTFQYKGGSNATLFASPADWISPNPDGGYRDDPPANDGSKVIIADTDHLWGIGGNVGWVWKSFCRGLNPIFMDPYSDSKPGQPVRLIAKWNPIRRNLGYTRRFAAQMDLAKDTPHNSLASTGYCLADPGVEYLVYVPAGGEVAVDLTGGEGTFAGVWLNPSTGKVAGKAKVEGGAKRALKAPFVGAAVLYLRRAAK